MPNNVPDPVRENETTPLMQGNATWKQSLASTFSPPSCGSNFISPRAEADVEQGAMGHTRTHKRHSEAIVKHLGKHEYSHWEESIDRRHDVMMYKNSTLVTWEAFNVGSNSVWLSRDLWLTLGRLGMVSIIVALLTLFVVQDPAALDISKFSEVSKFLMVAIGLLMGFFLADSANRWHKCVNGFYKLLDAVRNMSMQLGALGVPAERTMKVDRYGIASAWLLYGDLLTSWKRFSVKSSTIHEQMWNIIADLEVDLDGNGKAPLLTEAERATLMKMRDPSGIMWMWCGSLVGCLSRDGLIPGMATPTYGRIMDLCQAGHGGIRSVRASVVVQAPLPYVHTLAILVHINNLINAVCLGLVLGVQLGTVLAQWDPHIFGVRVYRRAATDIEVAQDTQMLVITFLFCFFGPLSYQALLIMAVHLSQPFDYEDASVPLDLLLHRLEADLRNGSQLLKRIPGFKSAVFKDSALPNATPK